MSDNNNNNNNNNKDDKINPKEEEEEKKSTLAPKIKYGYKTKYPKIDLHCHILPDPDSLPNLNKLFGYGDFIRLDKIDNCCRAKMYKGDTFFREIHDNCYNPISRIEDCDDVGVTVQAISTVPVMFSYWAKPEDCLEVSKILNNHIAGVCKKHPKKFVGLGTIPMHSPELAIKELYRCVNELGLVGIEIGTNINGKNLNEEEFLPIFEAAEKLGACIFVHPWDMMGWKQMEKYWLPWLVSMCAETSRAICSLSFGGVFEKCPDLKFLFAHGGGAYPGTISRIEHGFNVRPDLCQVDCKINPKDFLGTFWVDSLTHDEDMLKHLIKLMGKDKIVLGSDYPFPLGEHIPGKLVEGMKDLTDKEKAMILWKNGLEFLGVKQEQFIDKDDERYQEYFEIDMNKKEDKKEDKVESSKKESVEK